MEFLTININDIIAYLLMLVIYLFHFLANRSNRNNGLLLRKDVTKKFESTVGQMSGDVVKAAHSVSELDSKVDTKVADLQAGIRELSAKLEASERNNARLTEAFIRSLKHNDDLCKRGVTKQILSDLEGKSKD